MVGTFQYMSITEVITICINIISNMRITVSIKLRDYTKKRFTFNIKLGDVLQVCGRYDDIWRQSPGDLSISCISCIQVNVGRKGFFCFSSEKFSVFGGKTKKVGQSDRLSKWPVHTYFIMIIMIHVYHPNEFTHICAAENIFGPVDCSIGLIEHACFKSSGP